MKINFHYWTLGHIRDITNVPTLVNGHLVEAHRTPLCIHNDVLSEHLPNVPERMFIGLTLDKNVHSCLFEKIFGVYSLEVNWRPIIY